MPNVFNSPQDVKHILIPVDPRTGNFAVCLATDHGFAVIPVVAGQMEPSDLFYGQGEIDDRGATEHESGFIAFFRDDSTVQLPLKDLHRWPLPGSSPADFQFAITDFDEPIECRGIGAVDIVIFLWRPAQPGEITQQHINTLNTMMRVEKLEARGQDPHSQVERPGQAPARHLHVVSAAPEVAKAPEPEKPTPTEGRRSVGLTRKFAYIHPRIMELMQADGLSMLDMEVYRIIYTFREYPQKSRIREEGKGPAYPLPYTITYQSQIVENLKARKTDLMATARGERRNQARKMGTSRSSVQRAIRRLCEAGWIARVYRGLPEHCDWLSPEQQERRIQRHERVPQWGPQKYTLGTDKCQRDFLKGRNRKLKELGLSPYLINLPGPRF